MFKRISSLFSSTNALEVSQTILLPIPSCAALNIQLMGQICSTNAEQLKQVYNQYCNSILVYPFMNKTAFSEWLEKVLKQGGVKVDFNIMSFSIINAMAQDNDPDVIDKLVNRIKEQEQSDSVRLNDKLLDDLGCLRRSLKKIRSDKLTEPDKEQLSRLFIAVKHQLSVSDAQRWNEQISQMCKNTWSST